MGIMKRLLVVPVVVLMAVFAYSALQPSESSEPARVQRIPVLVTADTIPAGTQAADSLSSGLIEYKQLESSFVPADAVGAPELLTGESVLDLEQGEVVTTNMFG